MSFFLHGKRVGTNNQTNIPSTFILEPGTKVLAVRCVNYRDRPWILGSVSNGLVTDSRWKCFSLPKQEMLKGLSWTASYFDDSQWAQAVANFSNQEDNPRGRVPDIRDEALWIATAAENYTRLFCRRRLSDLSPKRVKGSAKGMSCLNNVNKSGISKKSKKPSVPSLRKNCTEYIFLETFLLFTHRFYQAFARKPIILLYILHVLESTHGRQTELCDIAAWI